MAIKWSPGCGCCRSGCETIDLKWIPSSPYDRGEYTDDDRWRPFTEYLQGDQFWELSEDRNGDLQKFLFTAPATMFSGGGWTLSEEARYSRGRGISYADGLEDFELLTNAVDEAYGWPTDQILLHEALQERKLREGQGLISRKEIAKEEWIATWNVEVKSTQEYDDMDMESLSVRVKFMGSAEYDPEVDDEPTSGIVTVVSKAAPHERVTAPYPEDCIPICEAITEEFWNPDDPQCGPKPPFKPEWKIEHGTFNSGGEILDDTYAKEKRIYPSLVNSRSIQPVNAVVSGSLDIPALLTSTVTPEGEPLDLHNPQVLAKFFGGTILDDGFESRVMQNAVAVVVEGGEVTQGGPTFTVETGDIIQVVDFIKLDADPRRNPPEQPPRGRYDIPEDGAFKHIPAAEIEEVDRTCYLSSQLIGIDAFDQDNYPDRSIEVVKSLYSYQGGKLAVYVEKFSDTDIDRTRNGEYYCEFAFSMCRIETPTSVQRPDCQPDPAFECECKPMDSRLIGVEFNNDASWSSCDIAFFNLGSEYEPSWLYAFGEYWVQAPLESSEGIEWTAISEAVSKKGDCVTLAARLAVAQSWSIIGYYRTFSTQPPDLSRGFNPIFPRYGCGIRLFSTLAFEVAELRRMDCIGQIDRAIMSRSVIGFSSTGLTVGTFGDIVAGGNSNVLSCSGATALLDYAKNHIRNKQLEKGRSMFCGNNRRFNDNMTTFPSDNLGRINILNDDGWKELFEGETSFPYISGLDRTVAASLHQWSLQTGAGEGCRYAASLKYPTLQEREDQIYRRHYETLFDCQDDPRALFAGQTSTIFTI
jgi:hypothetical protein